MSGEIIRLHVSAPPKPLAGQPCNGCGVCCALETCPAARLRFLQKAGPCPALEWSDQAARYHCGLLLDPGKYLSILPKMAEKFASAAMSRWIAAGKPEFRSWPRKTAFLAVLASIESMSYGQGF